MVNKTLWSVFKDSLITPQQVHAKSSATPQGLLERYFEAPHRHFKEQLRTLWGVLEEYSGTPAELLQHSLSTPGSSWGGLKDFLRSFGGLLDDSWESLRSP
jgi:hypothetical protein